MRRLIHIGYVLALVGIVTIVGCDDTSEPGTSGSNGMMHKVLIDTVMPGTCGGCFNDPCSWTYYLDVIDSMPTTYGYWDQYYWAELHNSSDTLVGEYTFLPMKTSNSDTASFTLTAHYYDLLPNVYYLEVFRTDSLSTARDRSKAQASVVYADTIQIGVYCQDCFEDCCTDGTNGRFWVGAWINAPSVIYARARIETQYGKLCGEDSGLSDSAQSCAWVTISEAKRGVQRSFIQFGYIRYRFAGVVPTEALYAEDWHAESTDPPWLTFFLHDPPAHGTNHRYEIEIKSDQSLVDTINFIYDDTTLPTPALYPAEMWEPTTAQYVSWAGEIRGFESDMPGTVNDPVMFWDCGYSSYGDPFQPALFNSNLDDMFVSKPKGEWGFEFDKVINRSWFTIVDSNVLP